MIRKIEFTKGNWEKHFQYAYTERFSFTPKFVQEEECIANGRNPEMEDGFDYTTIMTKEKYGEGTKLWVTSSFEKYGAPLVTITDSLRTDEHGNLKYGASQEFVLWEKGLNVWDFFVEDGKLKWNKIMSVEFPLEPGVKHEMYLEFMDKYVRIVIGDKSVVLRIENLSKEVYIGVTGCEDINRFYSVKIDTK